MKPTVPSIPKAMHPGRYSFVAAEPRPRRRKTIGMVSK